MLVISKDLRLPPDIVTLAGAALGIRGSGKTNTGVVITEGLLEEGQQVIVVDPLDAWWGIKSSRDGKRAGYPVIVLGGVHGDLPLAETDGRILAEFLVSNPIPAILSMRHLSKSAQRRLITEFAEELFHRKGEPGRNTPVLMVIDEASRFIPQQVTGDVARMVGAITDWVRMGRSSGIGVLLIDQRAASVNKDVLSQLDLLIAHRSTSPQDRKALQEWIQAHDTEGRAAEFMASLASLKRGEAWFWSPEWLDIFKRVQVRERGTYDSSATPKLGQVAAAPQKLATADLAALRERLAVTVEKAKADDPQELRRQIADLRQQMEALAAHRPEPVEVRVPVLEAAQVDRLVNAAEDINGLAKDLAGVAAQIISEINSVAAQVANRPPSVARPLVPFSRSSPAPSPRPLPPPSNALPGAKLPAVQRKILTVLAQYPAGRTKNQIALLTGYAINGGGFNNGISALRTAGYAQGGKENLQITGDGIRALGSWEPLPTGRALIEYWLTQLGKAERAIFSKLTEVYPRSADKEWLGAATGYEPSGGGFNNAISRLRTLELIEGSRDALRAAAAVCEGL